MRLVKIIFGMMGLAAVMLIVSSAEARPCFTNPSKGCKGIKVLEDSEAWFFDNVLDEKGEFRFKDLQAMHIHNEFNGLEYVVQRVVYERLGCLNIRARKYEYAFHDMISKSFAEDHSFWGFQFSEDRRFIIQRTRSDHYLLTKRGVVIGDTKTRKLIFVFFDEDNPIEPDWSTAEKSEKGIYSHLHPSVYYDEAEAQKFTKHHMLIFMPPDYQREDWQAILPIIEAQRQRLQSRLTTFSDYPSKTRNEDMHFFSIDCQQD